MSICISGGDDHCADADRYMLVSLHERTLIPKTEIEKKLEKWKQKSEFSPLNLNQYYYGETI